MYEIRFDHATRRLELRLWGFWTEAIMDRFAEDLKPEVVAAKARYTAFDILSDASEFPVQAMATVPRFGEVMRALEIHKYGRIAVVVKTMLNKVQAERAEEDPYAKIFLDRSAAIQWLAERR